MSHGTQHTEERSPPPCKACKQILPLECRGRPVRYCPFCGMARIAIAGTDSHPDTAQISTEALKDSSITWGNETPKEAEILFDLGNYRIMSRLGKGGMGEVFLAYDSICGRPVALKRIRSDLQTHSKLYGRFLREARLTSQLMHPAIIPIYAIHQDDTLIYYTMPYIEGRTLKEIIRETRHQEREGLPQDSLGQSIPALIRVFLSICQAVAYAHSHGVLHRDLKPDNVIVGKYGEITILDWGLAKVLSYSPLAEEEDALTDDEIPEVEGLTIPGKVVGTTTHMAPERGKGGAATIQTEVYSLGVTLYQILTLRLPFRRRSLEKFREQMDREILEDPAVRAPFREVPPLLSRVAARCLSTDPNQRYHTVDELIHDIENYLGGRSDWFPTATLDSRTKTDWAFQEHILPTDHMAITRNQEVTEWVTLMLSSASFPGNIRLEADLRLNEGGQGLGLMVCVPGASEQSPFGEGYCLWLGSDKGPCTTLYRSNLEVLHRPELVLKHGHWYHVRVEKVSERISLYLDNKLQFSYVSHLPSSGDHVGLLTRDANYELRGLHVLLGSMDITVSCLSVPDSFLAYQDYEKALKEYQRIANAFPGRTEEREALFRSGITLIEQAKTSAPDIASLLFDHALDTFEKLRSTPAAPLEYLGKSLVYQAQLESHEEINCLELGVRRYRKHPMSHVLREHIVYRMHESSRENRQATYRFALLVLQQIPATAVASSSQRLLKNIAKHWEPLPFVLTEVNTAQNSNFALLLAFWLKRPHAISEILDELLSWPTVPEDAVHNGIYLLLSMRQGAMLTELWDRVVSVCPTLAKSPITALLIRQNMHELPSLLETLSTTPNPLTLREIIVLIRQLLEEGQGDALASLVSALEKHPLPEEFQRHIDALHAQWLLSKGQWERVGDLMQHYSQEELGKESSPLHFPYGCWLLRASGFDIATLHFSGGLESVFPRTTALGAHYITKTITRQSPWFKQAFWWEKFQLYQQLSLWEFCLGHKDIAAHYKTLAEKELNDD